MFWEKPKIIKRLKRREKMKVMKKLEKYFEYNCKFLKNSN